MKNFTCACARIRRSISQCVKKIKPSKFGAFSPFFSDRPNIEATTATPTP